MLLLRTFAQLTLFYLEEIIELPLKNLNVLEIHPHVLDGNERLLEEQE